jgi:HK97 gp10 family phage protein
MASDRTVTGAGFKLVIKSGSLTKQVQAAVMAGLGEVGEQYKEEVIKVISLDDHTLQQLREMGYPYSSKKPEGTVHGDDRLVHEQEGELKRSIQVSSVEETSTRTFSVFATSNAPHMPFLIYGTSRMRPRRFHEKAFENLKMKIWKPVLNKLRKVDYFAETAEKE